jgi:tetratricopeptide (TPR) repeat protein
MKQLNVLLVIVFLVLLFSCAGGKPAKQIPQHLTAGGKQTKKGLQWYHKGCYKRSLEHFFRAYELYSAADVSDGVAMSLNNIGTIYRITGNYEEAVSFFDESVATYSDLNDQEGVVKALSNKAATLIRAGKLDKAELALEEAMQVLPAGSNERLLIPVLQNRGVLLTKRGSYEDAEKVLDRCLNQARSLDPMGMASLHFAYGNLMLKTGRSTDAIGSFIADDLFSIGQAYVKLGQNENAVRSWKRSAKVFALIDQAHELHETMNHLREAAQKAGADISVTEAFVQRWHDGKLYESPCKE